MAQRKYLTTTNVTYTPVYDNLGRVTSATTDNVIAYPAKFDYLYATNTNNISKETYSHRSGYPKPYAQFAYDRLNRVTRGDYKGSSSAPFNNQYEQFAMDDLGNRSGAQYIRGGSTVSYTASPTTNAYTQVGAANPAYDYTGNMTTDEQGYTYTYDYENRPLTISKNGTKAEFAYDALGRRINVTDSVAGTTTLYYYNTNWQVLCEKVSGTTQRWYVYGNYIDEPLMMYKATGDNTGRYYYVQDHLYSTVALVNNSGTVAERYEYDAYGKPRIMDASYNVRTASSYGNPYMFTGRNVDRLDGGNLWLQYNRNRYYSYTLGRWLTRDPLGYIDGLNLYQYVSSSPVGITDAYGFSGFSTFLKSIVKKAVCDRDMSLTLNKSAGVNLWAVSYEITCDCSYGYKWNSTPKKDCHSEWKPGTISTDIRPKSFKEAWEMKGFEATGTYGNDVSNSSLSYGMSLYADSWHNFGIKHETTVSVDSKALVWSNKCCKCAEGYVSCNCKGTAKNNAVAVGAVLAIYQTVTLELPEILTEVARAAFGSAGSL